MIPSKEFNIKTSPIHGLGLFANRHFSKGSEIGFYKGITVPLGTLGPYVWELDDFGINGINEMRYINHSMTPNVEFRRIRVFAIKDIMIGDEITARYPNRGHNFKLIYNYKMRMT